MRLYRPVISLDFRVDSVVPGALNKPLYAKNLKVENMGWVKLMICVVSFKVIQYNKENINPLVLHAIVIVRMHINNWMLLHS